MCVGLGRDPSTWVEVRLADFYAPELHDPHGKEAKLALARITRGKRVSCVAQHRSYDRIVAACRIHGVSVGDAMRAAGIREGGRGHGYRVFRKELGRTDMERAATVRTVNGGLG